MRPQRVGHNWATERLFVDWRSFSRAKRCLTLRWRKSHINCVFFYSVKPEVTLSSISLLMLSQAVKVHSTNVIVLYGSRYCDQFSSVQFLNCIWLFATPWTAACQASLSITISCSLLKLMSIESVMPSSHLILCHPLLLQNYCSKVPHVQGQRIPSKTVGAGAVAVMHWRNCDQIPHVQGQRRSPGKTVGGAKSHLEANPVPSREAQRAQTNLVCTRSQRPQRDWQNRGWVSPEEVRAAVDWRRAGAPSWAALHDMSNSMRLWAALCRATQDGQLMGKSSDKTWSPGDGNGKPPQCSCLENPMNSRKMYCDRDKALSPV